MTASTLSEPARTPVAPHQQAAVFAALTVAFAGASGAPAAAR